jgi:hypothetical protein
MNIFYVVRSSIDTMYYGLDIMSKIPRPSKLIIEFGLLTLFFSLESSNTIV